MTHLPSARRSGFELRGLHVLLICIAFFASIFAVNGALVYFALASFPGVERISSYQAGRNFPAEIERARTQDERHWKVGGQLQRAADGRVDVSVHFSDEQGRGISGLVVRMRLLHPARADHDIVAQLSEQTMGRYQATLEAASAGQWDVVIDAVAADGAAFRSTSRWILR